MSIKEFSKILQEHIVKRAEHAYKSKASFKGLDIKDLRKATSIASRHESLLSEKGIQTLVDQFSNLNNSSTQVRMSSGTGSKFNTYSALSKREKDIVDSAISKLQKGYNFTELLEYIRKYTSAKKITQSMSSDTQELIYTLENIPQTELNTLFINFIDSKTKLSSSEREFLFSNIQAEHTAGMFTLKLINLFGVASKSGEDRLVFRRENIRIPEEHKDRALEFINKLLNILLEADRLSSNIPNELNLFANSLKKLGRSNPTASTELQLSWLNLQSGGEFAGLGTRIESLLSKVIKSPPRNIALKQRYAEKGLESILEGIKKLVESLSRGYNDTSSIDPSIKNSITDRLDSFIKEYISTPSSPILIKDIEQSIVDALSNKKTRIEKTISTKTKVSVVKPNIGKNLKETTKSIKREVEKVKSKIKSIPIDRPSSKIITSKVKTPKRVSIPNLLSILNLHLADQIKKNMVKPALQNRTGRFAESVKVERLSESRNGMISAFYSYMKNPYQTFEPGYTQGSNKRNPKTLISKSIREIAAGLVGNRMRAVSI